MIGFLIGFPIGIPNRIFNRIHDRIPNRIHNDSYVFPDRIPIIRFIWDSYGVPNRNDMGFLVGFL